MGRARPWSTEELDGLRRLAEEGLGLDEVAERLGRTTESVRAQAYRKGIDMERATLPWTCSDVMELKRMFRQGLTYRDIGMVLGRSRCAVVSKARSLGLRRRPSHRWTDEEDARLLRMRSEGVPRKKCAVAIGVSKHAVDGRLELLRKRGRW